MKVFLVEDSLIIIERLRDMINTVPDTELIGEEDNGVDAMRGICILNPDLVILDLNLASGSGMDVLYQIRQRFIPGLVIVLTNYFNPQYQKKCMGLGADYFMDKSQELEKLGDLLVRLAADPQPHKYA